MHNTIHLREVVVRWLRVSSPSRANNSEKWPDPRAVCRQLVGTEKKGKARLANRHHAESPDNAEGDCMIAAISEPLIHDSSVAGKERSRFPWRVISTIVLCEWTCPAVPERGEGGRLCILRASIGRVKPLRDNLPRLLRYSRVGRTARNLQHLPRPLGVPRHSRASPTEVHDDVDSLPRQPRRQS